MAERRRYLTAKRKRVLWEQQGCLCVLCAEPKSLAELEWDHARPLWGFGTNDEDNWQGICRPCHLDKTKREATSRAKAKRQAGEKGQRARKNKRPIPSRGFDKSLRKRMDGRVEKRA